MVCTIALGQPQPLGASGTWLMTALLNKLECTKGIYGLQTMCEGGGQANVTAIAHTSIMKQGSDIHRNLDAEQFSSIRWLMIGELTSSSETAIGIARVGA